MFISLEEIEAAIQNRQVDRVRKWVPLYLAQSSHSDSARFQASEFYRRISDFSSALRVLHSEVKTSSWNELNENEVRLQLQLARILNLLGASQYAIRILSRCPGDLKNKVPYPTGGIYLSNYLYSEALPYFKSLESIKNSELSYLDRVRLVSLADCYSGLGNLALASELIESVLRLSPEPLLQGIANQAQTAYLITHGKTHAAAKHLEAAQKSFSPSDQTLDRGYLEKWIGAYLCLTGEHSRARKQLAHAWKILYRPGLKPETWLEVLFWQGCSEFLKTRKFPKDWVRILAYPGSPQELSRRIQTYASPPLKFRFSKPGTRARTRHYDQSSDTVSSAENTRLGFGLPDLLIVSLMVSDDAGIPQYRAYEALWPEETFSFQQLQKRMEQVTLRTRESGFKIQWRNLQLKLVRSRDRLRYDWSSQTFPGHSFLICRDQFTRTEVEKHFKISERSAAYLCARWNREGAIRKSEKRGKLTSYQVLLSKLKK